MLFPYIRSNLGSYLKAHWNDAEFQDDLLLLKEQVSYVHTYFESIRSLLCLAAVGYYICHLVLMWSAQPPAHM